MSKRNSKINMATAVASLATKMAQPNKKEELLKLVLAISPQLLPVAEGVTDFYIKKFGVEVALDNFNLIKSDIINELKITVFGQYVKHNGEVIVDFSEVNHLQEYPEGGVNADAETLYSFGISSTDSQGNLNLGCWFDDSYLGTFYTEVVDGEEHHYMVLTK